MKIIPWFRWSSPLALGLGIFLITVLSLLPGEKVKPLNLVWDKAAHAMAYGILALLVGLTFTRGLQRWLGILGLFGLGGLLEIGQIYVPNRSASTFDMLANGIGILLGVLLLFGIQWLWQRLAGSRDEASQATKANTS